VFNNIDAIFFTVSGAANGNIFTVAGLENSGSNGNLDVTAITFDSTPEPFTLVGCAAAALAFIWLGRRRTKRLTQGVSDIPGDHS
jgi:hypothetical protein